MHVKMSTESAIQFVPLKGFEDDYEILNEYPFTIRRQSDQYEIKESTAGNGYVTVHLNGVTQNKHELIALQFIPNDDPEHKTQVDHKNKHRDDYHIENLRWVTRSQNGLNKSSHLGIIYEYVDDIPEDSLVVDEYGKHKFEDYYFYDDVFYFYNGIQYRKLHINEMKDGTRYVKMKNIDNKYVTVCYSKFKRLHDLI